MAQQSTTIHPALIAQKSNAMAQDPKIDAAVNKVLTEDPEPIIGPTQKDSTSIKRACMGLGSVLFLGLTYFLYGDLIQNGGLTLESTRYGLWELDFFHGAYFLSLMFLISILVAVSAIELERGIPALTTLKKYLAYLVEALSVVFLILFLF